MTHPETFDGRGEGPAPVVPLGPVPDSPGEQDVLGLRISAALIDLVLLAGVLVIMACATGQVTAGGGGFGVWLDAAWWTAFLAIAGLYYFTLEAVFGQTVGKRLLGVQVYGPGGARPSAWAVAGRTLLRPVDFFPVLYLAGFVTMMATGARRQRIGDLAARTGVDRAGPVRHRGLAVVPLVVVLLAAAGLSAYRAIPPGGTLTYRAHGVSFGYPADWQDESSYTSYTITSGGAPQLWSTAVGPGTPHDAITVAAYRVNLAVTARDISAIASNLATSLRQAGLAVRGTPDKVTMAGLPGLRFRGMGVVGGTRYASTLVFAFHGTTEYFVNCQYTAGLAGQMRQACDQVTGSFHVRGAVPGAAARSTRGTGPTSGTGGLKAKVVPAPSGWALAQGPGVHNGPMSAAAFNRWNSTSNLAVQLHFIRGYDVTYYSNTNSDSIEVALFQFATPADAANFKTGFVPGGRVSSRTDAVIPGADDYDSTSAYQGSYDHGMIATRGNLAFVIDDITGSAAKVPLVEKMARQQYAALW